MNIMSKFFVSVTAGLFFISPAIAKSEAVVIQNAYEDFYQFEYGGYQILKPFYYMPDGDYDFQNLNLMNDDNRQRIDLTISVLNDTKYVGAIYTDNDDNESFTLKYQKYSRADEIFTGFYIVKDIRSFGLSYTKRF